MVQTVETLFAARAIFQIALAGLGDHAFGHYRGADGLITTVGRRRQTHQNQKSRQTPNENVQKENTSSGRRKPAGNLGFFHRDRSEFTSNSTHALGN